MTWLFNILWIRIAYIFFCLSSKILPVDVSVLLVYLFYLWNTYTTNDSAIYRMSLGSDEHELWAVFFLCLNQWLRSFHVYFFLYSFSMRQWKMANVIFIDLPRFTPVHKFTCSIVSMLKFENVQMTHSTTICIRFWLECLLNE